MKCFIKEYPLLRSPKACLNWYTKESFFNKVVNQGLRILTDPKEVNFLRLPFSDLFFSIKEKYKEQQ